MSKVVDWSGLPEELVDLTANRLFSNVELLRFRSICKPWRSAVATNKRRFSNRNRSRYLPRYHNAQTSCLLSPAAFFRVVRSSSPDKGWLIKTQDVTKYRKKLVCPLSRSFIHSSPQTLDLLEFTVTEIHQSYDVQYLKDSVKLSFDFARVVVVDNLVFVVDDKKTIWWCNSGESSNRVWTRISDEEAEYFSDIIVHKDHVYALDLKGAIWWISLSELNIFQYGPSTPTLTDYYETGDYCKDKRLVDYCEDLWVVHRFCKRFRRDRRGGYVERTTGFKVYKMDHDLVEWVEVKSLGDQAFVMATDACFSVSAREYYGCLENSIYFTDEEEKNNVKVFRFGDGTITKMGQSSSDQSCFLMFSPLFV